MNTAATFRLVLRVLTLSLLFSNQTKLNSVCMIPTAKRFKASVCRRSPAKTVGSNAVGACLSVCLSVVSVVCCQVEVSA
jgi:hypothetical protein